MEKWTRRTNMATSFDIIEDTALMVVDDYKLTSLYNSSLKNFKGWCDGFLIKAIPNFYKCKQSLEYDAVNRQFVSDLDNLEISILADFWVIEWISNIVPLYSNIY